MPKKNVLVIVEGEKKDVSIVETMFDAYGLDLRYNIFSYKTNIYVLYNKLFVDNEPDDIDILQLLKQEESDNDKKKIFDKSYTDIILLFDFEPQDSNYDASKIIALQNYFNESTDMGKLYIHYPMIEAFYHLFNVYDNEFYNRKCLLSDLESGIYKKIVANDTKNKMYNKLIKNHSVFKTVINWNILKIYFLITNNTTNIKNICDISFQFNSDYILKEQLRVLYSQNAVYVFSTICLFLYDYNPNLLTK